MFKITTKEEKTQKKIEELVKKILKLLDNNSPRTVATTMRMAVANALVMVLLKGIDRGDWEGFLDNFLLKKQIILEADKLRNESKG